MGSESKIRVLTDISQLLATADEWRGVYERCPGATPFQHPDWVISWAQIFSPERIRLVEVRSENMLLGLAPLLVREVFESLKSIREQGVTIVLVEQNVPHALALADRAVVLETGRVTLSGAASELVRDDRIRDAYLGLASV